MASCSNIVRETRQMLMHEKNMCDPYLIISLIQHFETDFLWKVSLKILNSGIILKTFTHEHKNTNP